MAINNNPEHKEGKVASAIEEQTARIPSDIFYGRRWAQWHYRQHYK